MRKFGIEVDWEHLERGSATERATFAAIGIHHEDLWLTEAEDERVRAVRRKVNLSGYLLAEWLVANWWRLRWEPYRPSADWALSHSVPGIGGGYVWPNLTFAADGRRMLVHSCPTSRVPAEPIRYLVDRYVSISAREFEGAIDDFVVRVIARLGLAEIAGSNLHTLWSELRDERLDPQATEYRKIEALLGFDVDGAPAPLIEDLLAEGATLGRGAVEEIAAAGQTAGSLISGGEIRDLARTGVEFRRRDGVTLKGGPHRRQSPDAPAWLLGVEAAKSLRQQQGIGDRLETGTLAEYVGISAFDLGYSQGATPLAFEFEETPSRGYLVLKSRSGRARRFELARILGDRLAIREDGALRPVTRSATYRQKLQRAFAAELLCPIGPLSEFMADERGEDRIEEASDHFEVSAQTVRLQLINNGIADRDEIDLERASAAALPLR